MAEAIAALGVLASCIEILKTMNEIRSFAQQNIHSNSSAKKELIPLLGRLMAYEGLLQGIKYEAETDDADATRLTALCHVNGPLQACSTALYAIRDRLMSLPKHVVFGKIVDKDILRAMQSLEDSKPILELALHADQRVLTKAIEEFVTKIYDQVTALRQEHASFATLVEEQLEKTQIYLRETDAQDRELTEQIVVKKKHQEVLAWLSPVDPSVNLRAAMKPVHTEARTGQWFLTGEEFSDWREGKLPYLWLQGLSGSGKTTLMSSVISTFKQSLVGEGFNSLVAYFFFEFNHVGKGETEDMIRSFLLQLAIQDDTLLASMEKMYGHIFDDEGSSLEEGSAWSDELIAFLARNDTDYDGQRRIYFMVDAVDECSDPEEFTALLERVSAEFADSSWLLSSTEDPSDTLTEDHAFTTVGMKRSAVDRDIQSYVTARLKKDPALRSYPPNRKKMILEALVSSSTGIFRWVACQLDALGVLRDRRAVTVKKALAQLPKTLNDTYQRILDRLPSDEDRNLVMKVLEFVTFAHRPLKVEEVAEAAVFRAGMARLSSDDRFDNAADIMTLCGSLVACQKDVVVLSHKSVMEFYMSSKSLQNEHNELRVSVELGKLCLEYISMPVDADLKPKFPDSKAPNSNARRLKELELRYPLLDYACVTWELYFIYGGGNVDLKPKDLEIAYKLRITGETTLWKAWLLLQRADIWDRQVKVAILITEALKQCSSAPDWVADFWNIRRAFRTQSELNKPADVDSSQVKQLHIVQNVSLARCDVQETYGEVDPLHYHLGVCLAEIALQQPLYGYRLARLSEEHLEASCDQGEADSRDDKGQERQLKKEDDPTVTAPKPENEADSGLAAESLKVQQTLSFRELLDSLFEAITDRMGHTYASAVRRCAKGDKIEVVRKKHKQTGEKRRFPKTRATVLEMVTERLRETEGHGYRLAIARTEAKAKTDAETVKVAKAKIKQALKEARQEGRSTSRWLRAMENKTHFFNSVPGERRGTGRNYAVRTANTYVQR